MIESLNHKVVAVTPPAAIYDNTSPTTAYIDTKGWDWVDVYVMLGATDVTMTALKLTECETSGGSYTDIAGSIFGGTGNPALPTDADGGKIYAIRVDCRGRKRFLDLVATAGNGSTGTFLVSWAVLSRGDIAPSSAALRGVAAEAFV